MQTQHLGEDSNIPSHCETSAFQGLRDLSSDGRVWAKATRNGNTRALYGAAKGAPFEQFPASRLFQGLFQRSVAAAGTALLTPDKE